MKQFHHCLGVFLCLSFFGLSASRAEVSKEQSEFLNRFSKEVFARFDKMASKELAVPALPFNPPATSTGIFCTLQAAAPDYLPWELMVADVEGDYVVLAYSIPPGTTVPGNLPRSIIFSYHLSGNYAPWYVYLGDKAVNEAKINSDGQIAFWRTQDVQPATGVSPAITMKRDELRVCSIDPINMNSQEYAYPCFTNIFQGDLVDIVPYDQPNPLLGGIGSPNGGYQSLDWSLNHLIFSRRVLSDPMSIGPYSAIYTWDRTTMQINTLQATLIYGSGNDSINGLYVDQVASDGTFGFHRRMLNFSGFFNISAEAEAFAIEPSPTTGLYQNPATYFTATQGISIFEAFNYWEGSGNFVVDGETHRIFRDDNFSTTALALQSSEDNYQQTHVGLQIPAGRTMLTQPRVVKSSAFGELVIVESQDTTPQGSVINRYIEVFDYQPNVVPGTVGWYVHMETILPTSPMTSVGLQDLGRGVNDVGDGSFISIQSDSSFNQRIYTYFRCI